MQFDVIIGNPPYQLDDGGFGTQRSARSTSSSSSRRRSSNPRLLVMVIPARWFAGGKGLDEFRESMLTDDRIRSIDDYLSASDVFPGVGLKGGVCYFLWDRDNPGPCRGHYPLQGLSPPRQPRAPCSRRAQTSSSASTKDCPILKKVVALESEEAGSLALPEGKRFDRLVSSLRPFGLRTYFQGKVEEGPDDLLVYQNGGTPDTDVEVTVRDPDGTPFATVTTDDEGAWRVPGLPVADDWAAEVTVPDGYRPLGPSRLSFDVVSAEVAGLDFALAVVVPPMPSPSLLNPTSTALPPTPDVPDQPPSGPGDLADTGGPSALLALLGLVLVAGGVTLAGLSAGRAHRSGG